ncbi:hypothetical protein V5799_014717 [Amblyomma americanum]|uniref:Uncharacterized protein n=1 Tax=Amblyomma americanum TaxID=6943 RepID=A0AAQ4E279_AMBAM
MKRREKYIFCAFCRSRGLLCVRAKKTPSLFDCSGGFWLTLRGATPVEPWTSNSASPYFWVTSAAPVLVRINEPVICVAVPLRKHPRGMNVFSLNGGGGKEL